MADKKLPQSQQAPLNAALALANQGFKVFPCKPDKKPFIKWKSGATTDPGQIEQWWHKWPAAMIGFPTGDANESANCRLTVIDIDRPKTPGNPDGVQTLNELKQSIGFDIETLTAVTASGGYHYFFKYEEKVKGNAGKIGAGIDARSNGGYVIVCPSSPKTGHKYQWLDANLAPADSPDFNLVQSIPPEFLSHILNSKGNKKANAEELGRPDPKTREEAKAYLTDPHRRVWKSAFLNLSEGARHNHIVQTAGYLVNRHTDYEEFRADLFAVTSYFSDPYTDEEIDSRAAELWKNLSRSASHQKRFVDSENKIRRLAAGDLKMVASNPKPTGSGKDKPDADRDWDGIEAAVAELNEKYFLTRLGSDFYATLFEEDSYLRVPRLVRLKIRAFHDYFANKRLCAGGLYNGLPRMQKVSQFWMEHPNRRTYDRLIFAPYRADEKDPTDDRTLNLFFGWGVQPKKGKHDKYINMLYEVVANCNDSYFDYQLNWQAHIVQKPWEPTRVFLALTGEREGEGKRTMFNTLCQIIGTGAMHISHVAHLLGKFNPQHEYSLLCFLDEAMEPGNTQGTAVLKALITEPYIHIEEKYGDQREVKNYMNICAASNNTHIVTAGLSSRRFAVFEVSDKYADRDDPKNAEYWDAIYDELDNGGRESFLHFLLNRDIYNFNPRDIPVTPALIEQRMKSMQPVEAWLVDSLVRGSFEYSVDGKTHDNNFDEPNNQTNLFSTKVLHQSFTHFSEKLRVKDTDPFVNFARRFKRYEFKEVRHIDKTNNRGYRLESLAEARAHITEKLKLPGEIFELGSIDTSQ